MHQRNRYGEEGSIPFRSSRFYCVNSEWYFATRRGTDQGPFTSKAEAKKVLIKFLNEQLSAERNSQQESVLSGVMSKQTA